MPAPALPQPAAQPLPGTVALRRIYRDALGRPMTGRVRISGVERAKTGETVVMPAPVNADVTAGVLEVWLPAGRYTLTATLTTVDGTRADDAETVTLSQPVEAQ